jgi:hypothetical protein
MKTSPLIAASAAIVLLLGILHLVYTFRGEKLHPRDADLMTNMDRVSPVISRETSMWRVWMGLNATHSFGLILFGLVYGYLAIFESAFLFRSWFLLGLGVALLLGYSIVARIYFFSVPLRGVALAMFLYVVGIIVHRG